jgi:DNA-binding response OmpR family regulator
MLTAMERSESAGDPVRLPLHEPSESATVLVVEDDPALSSILVYNLRREGYRVLAAGDGASALTLARREGDALALVLLDLMLPVMSGLEVLRALRAESSAAILIVSAKGEAQDRIDGLDLGADDYIVKPFVLRELLARVRAGVRRRGAPAFQPPAVLSRGPLRIEFDNRRALIGGEEAPLRPKEYGLLATLAREPGRLFSRQALAAAVWGADVIVDDRTISVHVSLLRTKLQQAGLAADVIQTVHGGGYRFVAPVG